MKKFLLVFAVLAAFAPVSIAQTIKGNVKLELGECAFNPEHMFGTIEQDYQATLTIKDEKVFTIENFLGYKGCTMVFNKGERYSPDGSGDAECYTLSLDVDKSIVEEASSGYYFMGYEVRGGYDDVYELSIGRGNIIRYPTFATTLKFNLFCKGYDFNGKKVDFIELVIYPAVQITGSELLKAVGGNANAFTCVYAMYDPEKFEVIEAGGVDGIENDSDSPAEYYNLQGLRVENPVKGIFLRRQGGKTSKVVF